MNREENAGGRDKRIMERRGGEGKRKNKRQRERRNEKER